MKLRRFNFALGCAVLLVMCCGLAVADRKADVSALLEKFPATNAAETQKLAAELVKLGPAAIKEICAKLAPPATGGDTTVRFALNGLAWHVSRTNAAVESRMYAGVLIEALNEATDNEVKAFLIRQLQLAGGAEVVAPLARLLADERLCEPATQALLAIHTPAAAKELLKALPKAKSKNRVTLIKALGDMRAKAAAKKLIKYAAGEDTATRRAALYAIANIGHRTADKVLANALKTENNYERAKVTSFYLLYARRLAEGRKKKQCVKICRNLMATRPAPEEANVKCAALSTLVGVMGDKAMEDLLAAMKNEDREFQARAFDIALTLPGKHVTARFVNEMKKTLPEGRVGMISMLGRRGDKAAFPALLAAMKNGDKGVRLAAVPAVASLGGADAASSLLAVLQADQADEIKVVKEAVMRLPGDKVMTAVAEALPGTPARARVSLLDILSARCAAAHKEAVFTQTKDADGSVRVAAIKALGNLAAENDLARLVNLLVNAQSVGEQSAARAVVVSTAKLASNADKGAEVVLAAMNGASNERKAVLLGALSGIGGNKALQAVVSETKSADAKLQDAAIRALSEWPDATAADDMLDIARSANQLKHHVLALRGYVRVVGAGKMSPEKKLAMYKDAMTAAKRPDEKKFILAGLANVRTIDSLRLAALCLDDDTLKTEAALTVARIACPERGYKGIADPTVLSALKKAAPNIKDKRKRKQLEDHISKIASSAPAAEDDKSFTSLFNGKDLTGWIDNTKGYVAENGKMVCRPGGSIYTEREYSDFILRFEFKLTPGANNGLGIRTSAKGDAAYVGMELQILDNTAEKYKNLKPWQFHGSIYGLVPAKRGHLKPVGEWNYQEVIANGPKIKVILNNTTIVDTDLSKIKQTKNMHDLKKHPGLYNKTGHIGFLGHGSVVEFRNIKLKKIDRGVVPPPEGFTALFNGKDLTGWKGLVGNPKTRAKMTPEALKAAQAKADEAMREHWKVADGVLVFDGKGKSLCTAKDYGDFEMLVDWKIKANGDSGIYLRGSPQVQIWDPNHWKVGSGGLYNNKKNPSKPLQCADKSIGEWNTFRIKMIGERVTVHLNGVLVVDNVVMENYWDRDRPIFPSEQIELQCHGHPVWFRNIFIREIPKQK